MKVLVAGYLDDIYMSFLKSPVACCTPTIDRTPRDDGLRSMILERRQPGLISAPVAVPEYRSQEWLSRSKEATLRVSHRSNFAVKRHLNAYNGFHGKTPRRPQISAPMDFRHVDHSVPRTTPKRSFRPLELSIYQANGRLSPMLPHFETIDEMSLDKDLPAFPPSAVMVHSRSDSALSTYRIPRKPVTSTPEISPGDWMLGQHRSESPEKMLLIANMESNLPKAPAAARLRSKTTSAASFDRVLSILQEKRELEQKLKDIEEVLEERRSVYFNSRPVSRATSYATSFNPADAEPLPPITHSFATRVASSPTSSSSSITRPKTTASSKSFTISVRAKSFSEASAAFNTPAPPLPAQDHPLPPPPLPLILRTPTRPPLRKKKSFSRVSNWLSFSTSSTDHSRNTSLDSVTNAPKAVTAKEGFYQCVSPPSTQEHHRASFGSDLTISTLETDTEGEQSSPPTTWSPQSTPGRQGKKARGEVKIRNLSVDEESDDSHVRRTFGQKNATNVKVQAWEVGGGDGVKLVDVMSVSVEPYMPVGVGVGIAF